MTIEKKQIKKNTSFFMLVMSMLELSKTNLKKIKLKGAL